MKPPTLILFLATIGAAACTRAGFSPEHDALQPPAEFGADRRWHGDQTTLDQALEFPLADGTTDGDIGSGSSELALTSDFLNDAPRDVGGADGPTVPIVASPLVIGTAEVDATVYDLEVLDGRLYAATAAVGKELQIFDISDPAKPRRLGFAAAAGPARSIAVVPPSVFVVGDGAQLEAFDISNGAAPRRLGGTPTADAGHAVHVASGRAYVTSAAVGDDFEIFDVANPADPKRLGGMDLLSAYSVRAVHVEGALAYVAGGSFYTINVVNPASPVVLDSEKFFWYGEAVALRGSIAFALEQNNNNAPQLKVFDVTNSRSIAPLVARRVAGSYSRDLFLHGDYLYIALDGGTSGAGQKGLQVFYAADPKRPTSVASATFNAGSQVVVVQGANAFVGTKRTASAGEVVVMEIDEP